MHDNKDINNNNKRAMARSDLSSPDVQNEKITTIIKIASNGEDDQV